MRELGADDDRAWRELADRSVEPNPFYEPDCLVPAATHQANGAEIRLLVAEEGGRFYGCMPVQHVVRWNKVPYRIATTQVRRMNYCGTPLLDPERGEEAVAAMLRAAADDGRSWMLALEDCYAGGPTDEAFRAGAGLAGLPVRPYETFERGFVARRPADTYQQLHKGSVRNEARRRLRLFREEFGVTPELVDRVGDPSAIEDYIELEASGLKAATGVAMKLVPGEPEYFRAMCERFAAQGRLYLPSLVAGDRTIAMNVWFRGQDALYLAKTSFDEELARFGLGRVINVLSLAYLHEGLDATSIDTCTWPGNWILEQLYPDRKRLVSYLVPLSRNPAHRMTIKAFTTVRPIHKRLYERGHQRPTHGSLSSGSPAPGSSSLVSS